MKHILAEIEEFVQDNAGCQTPQDIKFKVESYALRRQLQQEIFSTYANKDNKVFADHQRNCDDFRVKIGPKRIIGDDKVNDPESEKKKNLNDYDQFVEQMSDLSLEEQQKACADREMGFTEVI